METSFERVRAATACGPKKLKLISERKKSLRQLCPYRSRTSQPDSDIKSTNCRRRSTFSMAAQCTKKCYNRATHGSRLHRRNPHCYFGYVCYGSTTAHAHHHQLPHAYRPGVAALHCEGGRLLREIWI